MADICLSPSIVPNQADWTLLDFSGVQQSLLSGAIRTVSRGQRWQAHLQWNDLITDDRHYLSGLMAAMRGKSNRIWISDPTYKQRGSFPAPELLSNNYFASGVTGWTVTGNATGYGYNRGARLTSTGTGQVSLSQSITLANAVAYALRACIIESPNSSGLNIGVSLNDTGHAYTSYSTTARGLVTSAALSQAAGAATQYGLVIVSTGGSGVMGLVSYCSLRRCALAVNPSATVYGSSLPIDALPVSTNGLLLAGDRVEINGEMKTVTFDLNSDSSGNGKLMFEPSLRQVVPDNAPVHIGQPMMRGILNADPMQPTRPGAFSDFDFTFIEG